MTAQQDLAAVARAVIEANSYLTIATADDAGEPWPSPVWYAHRGYREFFWVSSPDSRHSRNLADRPQAGVVILDSQVPAGSAQAVYLTVTAAAVTPDELPGGIEVFSARSQARAGQAVDGRRRVRTRLPAPLPRRRVRTLRPRRCRPAGTSLTLGVIDRHAESCTPQRTYGKTTQ
jgi:pyridoxamine 5'-phosphate oxidase-like protein